MHTAGHASKPVTQGNQVISPLEGIDILPIEIPAWIGDANSQLNLLPRFHHLGDVGLEWCVPNNVISHEFAVHIDFCTQPNGVELKP